MDRLLTADELAERLGMKTEWVWAQARAGRIPHVRLGRYRRFRESAVEEWLCEIETGGTGRPSSPAVATYPTAPPRIATGEPRPGSERARRQPRSDR
jgi:excisionase family DNA binding protein